MNVFFYDFLKHWILVLSVWVGIWFFLSMILALEPKWSQKEWSILQMICRLSSTTPGIVYAVVIQVLFLDLFFQPLGFWAVWLGLCVSCIWIGVTPVFIAFGSTSQFQILQSQLLIPSKSVRFLYIVWPAIKRSFSQSGVLMGMMISSSVTIPLLLSGGSGWETLEAKICLALADSGMAKALFFAFFQVAFWIPLVFFEEKNVNQMDETQIYFWKHKKKQIFAFSSERLILAFFFILAFLPILFIFWQVFFRWKHLDFDFELIWRLIKSFALSAGYALVFMGVTFYCVFSGWMARISKLGIFLSFIPPTVLSWVCASFFGWHILTWCLVQVFILISILQRNEKLWRSSVSRAVWQCSFLIGLNFWQLWRLIIPERVKIEVKRIFFVSSMNMITSVGMTRLFWSQSESNLGWFSVELWGALQTYHQREVFLILFVLSFLVLVYGVFAVMEKRV